MNLLLIDSVDIPHGGAQSMLASWTIKGLRENKVQAFLIIPYGLKREHLISNNKKCGHFDGIPYCIMKIKKKINKFFRFIDAFIGIFYTSVLVFKRHRNNKLDAVILGGSPDILRDFPLVITCLLFKIPIFIWFVEKGSLSKDYVGIPGFLNKQSQKITERILPQLASGVIVISSYLKNYYLKFLPEKKILITPILVSSHMNDLITNINIDETIYRIRSLVLNNKLIVYSGSFSEQDGIFYLIDAFKQVIINNPNSLFIMTGKNHDNSVMIKIKNYINQLGLNDKIILTGFVDSIELRCYNSLADILLVCRSNSPFANHGFPWKLGEYCMTGKPIIATNVSDIEYYFKDNENLFIVNPNDPKAISSKVNYLFNNYSNALNVAQRGKENALHYFNYVTRTKEMIAFIKDNTK